MVTRRWEDRVPGEEEEEEVRTTTRMGGTEDSPAVLEVTMVDSGTMMGVLEEAWGMDSKMKMERERE